MFSVYVIGGISSFLRVLAAGDQVGILGWGWLLISLGIIFVVAILLIVAASWSDKSPYLEHLGHGAGHAGHVAVAEKQLLVDAPALLTVQEDNLTLIEGIGAKIKQILNEAGITTFTQLSETDPGRLGEILLAAGLQFHNPGTWPEQAHLAAQAKWQELDALKASLKGGRRS